MKYDLHMHTKYSKCATIEPAMILKTAKKIGLSGVAVTDHNKIKGALETYRLAKKLKDIDVIVGEEIMTDKGEVLAYYIQEEIKPGNIYTVIDKIRQQGGIISVSHPFSKGIIRKSAGCEQKDKEFKKVLSKVDALETFNARTSTKGNDLAKNLAKELSLANTGGSDAHFLWEIGRGYTTAKDDLRKDILKKKTKSFGNNTLFLLGRINSLPVKLLRL